MNRKIEKFQNPKGFAGLLMIVISALIMLVSFFIWQKYSSNAFRNVIGNQVNEKGEIIPAPEIKSPQGQVDAVRDMMNNIQDKKDKEIQKEMDSIK